MKYFYILLSISLSALGQTDTLKKYNVSELLKRAELAENGSWNAHHYYKEILKRNPSDSIKARTYYAIGNYYYLNTNDSNIDSAITATVKGHEYAEKSNNYVYNIICLINLSSFYAMKNENEKALDSFKKARLLQEKNKSDYYQFLRTSADSFEIYHLLGDFSREISENKKTIVEIDMFLKTKPLTEKQIAELNKTKLYLYMKLADNYCYMKKLDSASFYLQRYDKLEKKLIYSFTTWRIRTLYQLLSNNTDKALDCIKDATKEIASSRKNIYLSLYFKAVCFSRKKEYKKSLAFCESALKIKVIMISYENYELELYKLAAENAEKLGLAEKENFYFKKYSQGAQKINYQDRANFIAKLYERDFVTPLQAELIAKEKKSYYLWSGLVLVLALSGSYVGYSIYKLRKDKKLFEAILASLNYKHHEQKSENDISLNEKELEAHTQAQSKTMRINEETERKITKQLERFEKKQHYLSTSVSLSAMASDFGTNVSYLSAVIKKNKNQNFNNYINELRIDYIILKLKSQSEYSNYSIDYLAEESGFASYAVFVRAFTKLKGIAPSKFIGFLKQHNKEEEIENI